MDYKNKNTQVLKLLKCNINFEPKKYLNDTVACFSK